MKTTTEYSSRPLFMAMVLLGILAPLIAVAHTDLTDRLDVLNHKIKNNPQSLILYVERGKVFGLRGSYRDALKDYQFF